MEGHANDVTRRIIEALDLAPLEMEGGFFNETWRSARVIDGLDRQAGTCIHYLLQAGGRSFWHRLPSDEFWLYHAGDQATQLLLFPDGRWEKRVLGPNVVDGDVPQSLIPANVWQAAVPDANGTEGYSLFSAVVVPGFEFEDYEVGDPKQLMSQWPDAIDAIQTLELDK